MHKKLHSEHFCQTKNREQAYFRESDHIGECSSELDPPLAHSRICLDFAEAKRLKGIDQFLSKFVNKKTWYVCRKLQFTLVRPQVNCLLSSGFVEREKPMRYSPILLRFFSFLFCLFMVSGIAFGQEVRVSIEAQGKSIEDIIQDLRKTTSYRFTYNNEELKKAGKKTLSLTDVSIDKALKAVFEGTNLDVKIDGNSVLITPIKAAKIVVSGIVEDADKLGIPGVTVQVKGTTGGTTTDINGYYQISTTMRSKLVFSFLGMETQEVVVTGAKMNVSLLESASTLQEVVVTAYGVSRKATSMGAAAQVGEEVVKRQTGANVISNLQGSLPGVQISITSGSPGSSSPMQIRGLGSINAGTSPLYVIDGIPVFSGAYSTSALSGQNVDPLSSLNTEDIETISVLKDASATSIYGARASNGVVVITTKSGKAGKSNLQFNMKIGQTRPTPIRHNFKMLESDKYIELLSESLTNAGISPTPAYLKSNFGIDQDNYENTDWWDLITSPGLIQEYNLSASGGDEKLKYFVSGGYFEDQGFIVGGGTKRVSVRLNLESKLNSYFTLGNNLAGSYSFTNSMSSGLTKSNPMALARMLRPTESPVNADGSWNMNLSTDGYNPVALYTDEFRDVKQQKAYRLTYSPYLRAKLTDNLFIQTKLGIDYLYLDGMAVLSMTVDPSGIKQGGVNTQTNSQQYTIINTNTVNWMPSIGKNNFNILLGQEMQETQVTNTELLGTNFASPKLVYAIANATERLGTGNNYSASSALLSFFSNVEYDYNDKYYLSASLRRDGSSRFADGSKWGTFFSVGGKYRISQENFMKKADVVDNLTLRVSYGTTGNQDVGFYQYMGLYGYGANYDAKPGSNPTQLYNPDLTWEKRKKFNVGLDVSLFGRLSLELDYFNDKTTDLLFAVPITQSTGFSSMLMNVGSMRNSGLEGLVNVLLINRKNFRWTVNVNFTTYKNKILKLAEEEPIKGTATIREEGRPWNQFWIRQYGGVDPQTGLPLFLLEDGTTTTDAVLAGADENRKYYGTSDPTLYGGFGTKLDFYGFDFSIQFVYRLGGYTFSDENQWGEHTGWNKGSNWTNYVYDNRWKEPGDVAKLPKLVFGKAWDEVQRTEAGLQPLSHLKIRNITLGYNVPKSIAKRIYMSNIRVYVSADNIFSLYSKDYRGYDVDADGTATADNGYMYPTATNFIFGLNLSF